MRASRTILACGITSMTMCVSTCWGAPGITATLEVTQGMQYAEAGSPNSLRLVAGRRTMVRTKVVISGVPKKKIDSVTGVLKVTPPLTPTSTFTPLNGLEHTSFQKSKATFNRVEIDHTLNFQVDNIPKGTWTFSVDVTLKRVGTAPPLTTSVSAPLTAIELRKIEIHIVPMKFDATPAPTAAMLKDEAEHFRSCLPLPEYAPIIIEGIPHDVSTDANCIGVVDDVGAADTTEVDRTLSHLVYLAESSSVESFYYGFLLNDNSIAGQPAPCPLMSGWGRCKGGFGMAGSSFSGKTFAHEFGHFLGFDHCVSPGCGGVLCDMEAAVPVNVYGGPRAFESASYMVCGPPFPPPGWSTPTQWNMAMNVLDAAAPPAASCKDDVGDWTDPGQEKALVVHGRIRPEGGAVQWLDPMARVPWIMRSTPMNPGNYSVTAEDSKGIELDSRNFNPMLRVEPPGGGLSSTFGFFSVILAIPPASVVHKVIVREGAVDLQTVTRSMQSPSIGQVMTIPPGVIPGTINAPFTLQWTTSDADTPPADRLHHVVYSPSNSEGFQPVAVNIRSSSATLQVNFDPDDYFPSNLSNGLIWIVATDGLNTVVHTITGLEVP